MNADDMLKSICEFVSLQDGAKKMTFIFAVADEEGVTHTIRFGAGHDQRHIEYMLLSLVGIYWQQYGEKAEVAHFLAKAKAN